MEKVSGRKNCYLTHLPYTICTKSFDVSVSTDLVGKISEMAVKGAARFRCLSNLKLAVFFHHLNTRHEIKKAMRNAYNSITGSAASVRNSPCLMKVVVNSI